MMDDLGYLDAFNMLESFIERIFTKPLSMCSNDTYQFSDYSKYKVESFSAEEKIKHREKQFPIDLENAFFIGKKLLNQ
jgi:hypothetical protein